MQSAPSSYTGATRPVENVSWYEALAFCERLTAREQAAGRLPAGYEYRLPTEAEWEYAARAGSKGPFYWGVTADPQDGNFQGEYPRRQNTRIEPKSEHGTQPVARYQPNDWGLYDVHGNVAEWALDYYNSRLPGDTKFDWVQTQPHVRRAIRGGGWRSYAKDTRAAYRDVGILPSSRMDDLGFRVVLAPVIDSIDRTGRQRR
jgi:formylglycine-generating enzyme required for sulfatase activity